MSQNIEHFGKYILLEKLATGGMAEVWLARAPGAGGIGKFVAMKKILPQFSDNPEFIQMFKDEAAIAMNLSHSNIVSIYEFGQEKNQLFLVMDYVEGRNLRQMLNKMKQSNHKFSTDQIIYAMKEVAAGLDHAHRSLSSVTGKPLNITHRDMSPQNIMITFEGEVKIVDFGIAKAESQMENTRTGTLKGKFGYMSPEQAEGQPTDLRTDVFSLGICLWELLASDRLFIANNEINTLRKIRECNIPSLSKINPNINSELERIVMKALTRDRNLRYQTAAALHRDLNRFLNRQYPDFSPHDFSVFIKTLYTDEILDLRKRLVEYAKIPFKAQTIRGDALEKTVVSTISPNLSGTATGLGATNAGQKTKEHTVTETETFTDSSQSKMPKSQSSQPNVPSDSSPSIATASDIVNNPVFNQKTANTPTPGGASDGAMNANATSLNLPILDDNFIKESLKSQIVVTPRTPMTGSGEELAVDYATNQAKKISRNTRKREAESNSSSLNLLIFITCTVFTYFGVSTYYPHQTAEIQNMLAKYVNMPSLSTNPDTAPAKPKNETPVTTLPKNDPPPVQPPTQAVPNTATPAPVEAKNTLPPDFHSTVPLVVNSIPSGADIYLNGLATGKSTPSRLDVPAEGTFSLTLKLNRFLDYTKTGITAQMVGRSFSAALQKALVAYIDIDVKPPVNARIVVNGQILKDETLPITRYAIPAGTPVVVRAEHPISGAVAEETITLKEDQRYKMVLQLDKNRAPADNRK